MIEAWYLGESSAEYVYSKLNQIILKVIPTNHRTDHHRSLIRAVSIAHNASIIARIRSTSIRQFRSVDVQISLAIRVDEISIADQRFVVEIPRDSNWCTRIVRWRTAQNSFSVSFEVLILRRRRYNGRLCIVTTHVSITLYAILIHIFMLILALNLICITLRYITLHIYNDETMETR